MATSLEKVIEQGKAMEANEARKSGEPSEARKSFGAGTSAEEKQKFEKAELKADKLRVKLTPIEEYEKKLVFHLCVIT